MKSTIVRAMKLVSSGALLTFVLAAPAYALPAISAAELSTGPQVVSAIFKGITFAAVILFVILLVIGGIQYLGSFGNEEATTKARKLLLDAVVGLFIVLAAGGIASLVFTQLGVQNQPVVTGGQINSIPQ